MMQPAKLSVSSSPRGGVFSIAAEARTILNTEGSSGKVEMSGCMSQMFDMEM